MLALRVGLERVFIAQVPSTLEVRMMVELGKSHPLWCGAQGKAILAYMEESEVEAVMNELIKSGTRVLASGTIIDIDGLSKELAEIQRQGFAVSFAERVPGAAAVAAPIFERDRRVVGAIAIGGPLQRFAPDIVNRFGRLVSQAATEISLEFGNSPEQQSKEKNDRVPL
jgi:DNA-binding IclR family transcriptional regulator